MDDRELLELAAKAAGYKKFRMLTDMANVSLNANWNENFAEWVGWNPITNDGDAMRLAVKLRLRIEVNERSIVVESLLNGKDIYEYPKSDQNEDYEIVYSGYEEATRRAIVRAAAEIGKGMK